MRNNRNMGPPMHSMRAQLLTQVLDYIDRGDYDDSNEFLVSGKKRLRAAYRVVGRGTRRHKRFIRRVATKRKKNDGERIISKRTSLSAAPADTTKADIQDLLSSLPEETKALLAEHADAILSEVRNHPPTEAESEALDAALARNAVHILDQSFARLSTWDEVEIDRSSVRNADYFEEAHKCDIFGLTIACAVLCRAIVEDALIKTVDQNGQIKAQAAATKNASHIRLMLEEAKAQGLFNRDYAGRGAVPDAYSTERVKAGLRIRDAGDDAIHNLSSFRKVHAVNMRDVIDDTRKIVFELFRDK